MKKLGPIIFSILIVMALGIGVILVNQSQETRRGAFFAGSSMLLQPTEKIIRNVGEDVPVHLYVDSKTDAKVDAVRAVVCYDNNIGIEEAQIDDRVVVETASGFQSNIVLGLVKEYNGKKCVNLTVASTSGAENLKSGMIKVAVINFLALTPGEGNITIDKARSQVTGDNPGDIDKNISIDAVAGTSYMILAEGQVVPTNTPGDTQPTSVPTAVPTEDPNATGPVLNFKVAFKHTVADGSCNQNWPLQLTVLGNGVTKVYSDVRLTRDTSVTDKLAYTGSKVLADFPYSQDLAVFIKGPMQLQTKYGVSGQTAFYNQAGGQIDLTDNKDTSPMMDFTGYPLLGGDVVGNGTETQDGMINGLDFSYIKKKAATGARAESGSFHRGDLNGDCIINVNDVAIFTQSLKEKLDQLY